MIRRILTAGAYACADTAALAAVLLMFSTRTMTTEIGTLGVWLAFSALKVWLMPAGKRYGGR